MHTRQTVRRTMNLKGMDRSAPYLTGFASADAGKTLWYALRWVNTAGDHGTWGTTVAPPFRGTA